LPVRFYPFPAKSYPRIGTFEEEKFCLFCGKPYNEIGLEEVSSEVCVEKKYYLKKN
jgi:hypothetical protein